MNKCLLLALLLWTSIFFSSRGDDEARSHSGKTSEEDEKYFAALRIAENAKGYVDATHEGHSSIENAIELLEGIEPKDLKNVKYIKVITLLVSIIKRTYRGIGGISRASRAYRRAYDWYPRTLSKTNLLSAEDREMYIAAHVELAKTHLVLGRLSMKAKASRPRYGLPPAHILYRQAFKIATASLKRFPEADGYVFWDITAVIYDKLEQRSNAIVMYERYLKGRSDHDGDGFSGARKRLFGASLASILFPISAEETNTRKSASSASTESGAWCSKIPKDVQEYYKLGTCGIDAVDASSLAPSEFLANYVERNRPVILRGFLQHVRAISSSNNDDQWDRHAFLNLYGNYRAMSNSGTYTRLGDFITKHFGTSCDDSSSSGIGTFLADSESKPFVSTSLRGVGSPLQNTSAIAFESAVWEHFTLDPFSALCESSTCTDNAREQPPVIACSRATQYQNWNASDAKGSAVFYLGPAGSSAGMHRQTNKWDLLIHGTKKWYFASAYDHSGPQGVSGVAWERAVRGEHLAFECAQETGDLVYVGTDTYHAEINVADSVGVAVEFGALDLVDMHLDS